MVGVVALITQHRTGILLLHHLWKRIVVLTMPAILFIKEVNLPSHHQDNQSLCVRSNFEKSSHDSSSLPP